MPKPSLPGGLPLHRKSTPQYQSATSPANRGGFTSAVTATDIRTAQPEFRRGPAVRHALWPPHRRFVEMPDAQKYTGVGAPAIDDAAPFGGVSGVVELVSAIVDVRLGTSGQHPFAALARTDRCQLLRPLRQGARGGKDSMASSCASRRVASPADGRPWGIDRRSLLWRGFVRWRTVKTRHICHDFCNPFQERVREPRRRRRDKRHSKRAAP